MAKKSKTDDAMPALDSQVENGDSITIADVKQFIIDDKKARDPWLSLANRSWREIEKKDARGRYLLGENENLRKKWARYPLWWVTLQIRIPITLARLPVPILKDTQGDDPFGRTACVIGERLTRGILKTFDAFGEFSASTTDFLVTNFGWGRWCYRMKEYEEEEKLRLEVLTPEPQEPQMGPDGQPLPQEELPPVFITPEGGVVEKPLFDEFGPYMLTGSMVTIDNEEVYFESGLYNGLLTEAAAPRWSKVTRLEFETEYSYREFKEKFGPDALTKIADGDIEEHRSGKPIVVYEYHDKVLRECRWLADNSGDFFQPAAMTNPGQLEEVEPENSYAVTDLYGLSDFFPCTEPMLINSSTKEFWPVCEYHQVSDILDDIHQIVGRMILLTKAIRVRFLFDSSIRELKQLIGETGEGGGLGVPNLQQSLITAKGGSLANLVAYFPVAEMIEGLKNMYEAFDQRLNMYYNLTGLSDLIRGQTLDVEKTYGERQLEGKFAMNRFEPFQRKVQEWIKDNYQMGMEMALKMFSPESLDEYITPQTLDPEDKQRYEPALELLKSNKRRRFRVDFETDSTIAINQEWKRKQAIDLANTLTKALESTAQVAETNPELGKTELKVLKHLVGEFSDGKLFVDEIQDSIEDVIEKAMQPKPPEPNIELEKLKMDGQAKSAEFRFKQMELQTSIQLEYAKIAQKERFETIKNQLAQVKLGIENGASQVEMQVLIQQVQNEIAQGWEKLSLTKEALLANVQAEVGKREMEQMRTILDARVKSHEMSLQEAEQALKAYEVQITAADNHASLQERIATEQRLQEEHGVNMEAKQIDAAATLLDALKPEAEKAAPVSIDLSRTLHVKAQPAKEKKTKKDKPK